MTPSIAAVAKLQPVAVCYSSYLALPSFKSASDFPDSEDLSSVQSKSEDVGSMFGSFIFSISVMRPSRVERWTLMTLSPESHAVSS